MAVTKFATNSLVKDHDIYVKYLKMRAEYVKEYGKNPATLFIHDRRFGVKKIDGPYTSLVRAICKWHCIALTYDAWWELVHECKARDGAIPYKKVVHVPASILMEFKKRVERRIYNAKCDYNHRIPHGEAHYDACRYLAMFWTYLDIIKDEKTQRFFPDASTREEAARIFGYNKNENPFQMNGVYWKWDTKEEELPMEDEKADILETDIEDMDLSVRAYNILKSRGRCNTLGDILNMTLEEIMKLRGTGKKVTEEIINKLKSYGYEYTKKDKKPVKIESVIDIAEQAAKEVEEDKRYEELLKTAQKQADMYDDLLRQKLDLDAYIPRLKEDIATLKEENQELKERNSNLSIAANPNNLDTITLLNTVLEKMKHSKMEYILMTIDGMTIDIHPAKSFPLRSTSYQIRSSEVR